jgi:2-methylfumaryl-CoA isomerase
MVVALTPRQWTALVEATDTGKVVAAVEDALGADFADEGQRWVHRDVLTGLLKPWFRSRTLPEVAAALDERGVLWSPYRHFTDTVRGLLDGRLAGTSIRPAADGMLATSGAIRIAGTDRTPGAAPRLGEHTDAVLAELL